MGQSLKHAHPFHTVDPNCAIKIRIKVAHSSVEVIYCTPLFISDCLHLFCTTTRITLALRDHLMNIKVMATILTLN